ncbi:bifunctional aspartate kinase/homoserine dehydrogenase I [Buchnera aphidicola (Kurisakia onigurumii)]|uniref:bifunctional aspartate kinase/homoserine dehydrogenase I n=1 Tax=Buchnera aphidicola TaxID=9 RepID=UPI0031B6CF2E
MRVLKFGGSSLSNADLFFKVSNIIIQKNKIEQVAIVLSAPAKITNYFIKTIEYAVRDKNYLIYFNKIIKIFNNLLNDINNKYPNSDCEDIKYLINHEIRKTKEILYAVKILKKCPDEIQSIIISRGEKLSVIIMEKILKIKKIKTIVINPEKKIIANNNFLNATVNISESKKNIQEMHIPVDNIILMSGFVARNKKKEIVVLGRDGSDYSAAILSVCLEASICEIWTDVNGIYSFDPKKINSAKLIKNISYEEAKEFSQLGSKVLHSKTILPLEKFNISCIIKNTLQPNAEGTFISKKCKKNTIIKGISCLNNFSIIKIYIKEKENKIDIFSHIKKIISNYNIQTYFISCLQENHSINIYFSKEKNKECYNIFKKNFKNKKSNTIKKIEIIDSISIISIIGKNIVFNKKINKIFLKNILQSNCDIISVIKNSSNNSISIIVQKDKDIQSDINHLHKNLFFENIKKRKIEIFLIGIGKIGKTLLNQLSNQKNILKKNNIFIKLCSISNTKYMIFNSKGINIKQWELKIKKNQENFQIEKLKKYISKNKFNNPVLIDCTASQEISDQYLNFISLGCHIITPNKKANTSSYVYYEKLRNICLQKNRKFLYETNVGAGLPIIDNLQKLIQSGDKIIRFVGILSGSLSFIFGKLNEGFSLYESTKQAMEIGLTEPNPKEDLSGIDVARKLLIIAREIGYKLELKDIKIDSLFPKKFDYSKLNTKEFLSEINNIDSIILEKIKKSNSENKVLKHVGIINQYGKCSVEIISVNKNDPLYTVKNGENILSFYTKYYQPIPLILRGYGAGNNVTASGIFSDLLRLIS